MSSATAHTCNDSWFHNWHPACGGTEQPFTKNGTRYLYVFQPCSQRHAYLNLDTDMILTDAEAYKTFSGE